MKYILVIDHYVSTILSAVKKLSNEGKLSDPKILILTRHPESYLELKDDSVDFIVEGTDFEADVEETLKPYKQDIAAVVCRGDKQVQFLRKIIPFLPEGIKVSSVQSLEAATNKRLMREEFSKYSPQITPRFLKVQDASDSSLRLIQEKVPFPVIVKPASLVSSLLIQRCQDEVSLKIALDKVFHFIDDLYKCEERADAAEVIVEEYMSGDFYSIDAYVRSPDQINCCPPVAYIPAQQIGVDDFFLYKRFVPTELTMDEIEAANLAAAEALRALGLTYTSAHVELINTADGWRIIEVGPRLGRFRNAMYRYGYGIDHSYNDIAVHLDQEPKISIGLVEYCTAYSIYPHQEGVLEKISGIDSLIGNPNIHSLKVFAKPGDKAMYAKHGGKAMAEFIVSSPDKQKFDELTKFIETEVKAVIRS